MSFSVCGNPNCDIKKSIGIKILAFIIWNKLIVNLSELCRNQAKYVYKVLLILLRKLVLCD